MDKDEAIRVLEEMKKVIIHKAENPETDFGGCVTVLYNANYESLIYAIEAIKERDELRKHLKDANRGAETNSKVNQLMAKEKIQLQSQLQKAKEGLSVEEMNKIISERYAKGEDAYINYHRLVSGGRNTRTELNLLAQAIHKAWEEKQ